jgi:hypothetical protein
MISRRKGVSPFGEMRAIMKIAIAFVLVVADVTGVSAQMWTEDMSNGARSNPNSKYVQPRATQSGTNVQGYPNFEPNSTQRDNSGTRRKMNPYIGTNGTRAR